MSEEAVIKVADFSKKYWRRSRYAVQNATFGVNRGTFHGLIGSNGAGKTTTIKAIVGALARPYYQGTISVNGHSVDQPAAKKAVGYVPENINFPAGMNAAFYLRYLAFLAGASWRDSARIAHDLLAKFDLLEIAKKRPRTFSSGQKKKLLLAQSLIGDPQILILDEPTANLDPRARREFFSILDALCQAGKTVFISSHVLAELEPHLSHLTVIEQGQVVYSGAVTSLIEQYTATNKYKITFASGVPPLLIDFLQKENFTFVAQQNSVTCEVPSNAALQKISHFLTSHKIAFEALTRLRPHLDEVYRLLTSKTTATGETHVSSSTPH